MNPGAFLNGAMFSEDRVYRYELWRHWGDSISGRVAMFIGLNPSTADEVNNDPTVRRCIDFAKRWGCYSLCMTNIFAYRSTDPKALYNADDPVGPYNDLRLRMCYGAADIVVACWGNHGEHLGRGKQVRDTLGAMMCFGVNKGGHPKHPLYLNKETKVREYK